MRIAGWRVPQICDEVKALAIQAVNDVSDEQVRIAKALVRVGTIYREGKFKTSQIVFSPKTKRRKKIPIEKQRVIAFQAQVWTGRYPGQLRDTIRRVNIRRRPGNIRVYAGDKKTIYGHFLEYGTRKMKKFPFMKPSFSQIKSLIRPRIEDAISSHNEVK